MALCEWSIDMLWPMTMCLIKQCIASYMPTALSVFKRPYLWDLHLRPCLLGCKLSVTIYYSHHMSNCKNTGHGSQYLQPTLMTTESSKTSLARCELRARHVSLCLSSRKEGAKVRDDTVKLPSWSSWRN